MGHDYSEAANSTPRHQRKYFWLTDDAPATPTRTEPRLTRWNS